MSALPGSEPAVFAFGPFVLDRQRRSLTRDGVALMVTPKAFDLLVVLVERGGAVVTKDALMSALWPDTTVEESNLTFQVSTLRKALGPEGARYIATIPGRGYQFAAPLQSSSVAPQSAERVAEERSTTRPSWLGIAIGAAIFVIVTATATTFLFKRNEVPPSSTIRSLAVLPFKPLAAAHRDEALELGMADTLITRLSHMPNVVVRPIGAVRRYSDLQDDPLEAGRALGVDAVVDGSIQRRGERLRVTVRLLRTSDGSPIWASQMDENAGDLFAVQDRVAENVARFVVPALSSPAQARAAQRLTDDLEAYELYLKGRYWMWKNQERAGEFFERAIARDPKFAAAYAANAGALVFLGRYENAVPTERFEKARTAALKAVELDPNLAEAHVALAQVYGDYDWNIERAEREYLRALELDPNSDAAHAQYAYLVLFRRDFDRALFHAKRARQIDPVSASWAILYALVHESMRNHDEAIRSLQETLRLHPKLIPALLHLGIVYTDAGKPQLGIKTFEQALGAQGDSSQLLALKAWAHAVAGERETALRILRDLETRAAKEPVAAANIATAWTALGDHDRAFEWLERGYKERIFLVRIVTIHPSFAPLRDDPRYADLVRRLGF